MQLRPIDRSEQGRVADLGPADVLAALAQVRTGRIFDLDAGRFPGMPQWEGHPPFMLTTFRSPRGTAVQGDVELLEGPGNAKGFGFVSELLITGMHIGTHIDALCHVTCNGTWCGGFESDAHLGDFGATRSDAATIPPIVVGATVLDIAGHRGVEHLPAGEAVTAGELAEVEAAQRSPIAPRAAVLVRTGLMSQWPDRRRFDAANGAGIDEGAARWLREERDVVLVGADTPAVEQIPSADPAHPHPVHEYLLRQQGVHLLENLWLEELAAAGAWQSVLVCLPLKIAGATGSMVRPIAIL